MIELSPALRIPVVRTPDLRSLVAHYREALGFELVQQVPSVVALLRLGPVRLQLWQRPAAQPGCCRIRVDGEAGGIFALHRRLLRQGAALAEAPELRAWGAWEFGVRDAGGNQLVFSQWATTLPEDAAPGTAAHWLRHRG